MGWIDQEEQKIVREKFGVSVDNMCDGCGKPIVGLVFIDPKGGYFPKPPGLPDFLPKKPRRTFCQECDDNKTGKVRPPKAVGSVTVHGDGSVSVKVKKGKEETVGAKEQFDAQMKVDHAKKMGRVIRSDIAAQAAGKGTTRLAQKMLELLEANRKKKWKVSDLRELLSSAHSSKQIREALNYLWAGAFLKRENGGLRARKGAGVP